jgi:hypothetical protein
MSAAMPAQSPTLSPTRSAMTAAFRGSSSADVGRLGEDAAADAHEERQERPAEPEPEEGVGRGFLENEEDDGPAE